MSSTTFILIGITYYIVSIIIIIVVLNIINKKDRTKYLNSINNLEREKNLIISAGILTELNKVENLINNDTMKEMYDDWQKRFKKIKEEEIPKITDSLIEIQDLFDHKKYHDLKAKLAKTELDIYYVKTYLKLHLDPFYLNKYTIYLRILLYIYSLAIIAFLHYYVYHK